MPTRILRDGILSSERVARLSFGAEVFYRRVMSLADDYGRYTADLRLLRAGCFPLRVDEISIEQVALWLEEIASRDGLRPSEKPLVMLYEVNGKPYLEIQDFGQVIRANKSKYPTPPGCAEKQPYTPKCSRKQPLSQTELETDAKADVETVLPQRECADDIADRMYNRHPKLQNRPLVEMACARLLAEGGRELLERVERVHQGWCASEEWKREGGKYVHTLDKWLNDRAWMREASKPAVVRTMPVMRDAWGPTA